MSFIFELDEDVRLLMSQERGVIKGRAQYLHGENQYYILYKAADGRQVESWWGESAVDKI